MADNHFSETPIDPELKRGLEKLRAVPPRDPKAAARGKASFIAEVDEIAKQQGFSHNNQPTHGTTFYQRWKEKWNMATPRFRTVFSLVAALVLVAVFLFGGAGMTAYASQSALPGDALYGLKTGVEQTRVSLARDAADKANLNLAFAERRLDEIARLIANGRYKDIAQAVQEYERYVQSAIAALETVAAGDPAGAQALASQVAVLLKRYTETLSGMVGALPDTARGEVERAIQVSNDASSFSDELEFTGTVEAINPDSWVVDGQTLTLIAASEIKGTIVVGDLVKVHALQDANGALVLREVELASGDDFNENGNGNANGNENENGNANDNGDDDHEFTGIVEQIGADFWVIGGQTLGITAGSEIHGIIQVGDFVKVETTLDASGNLVLREVKLAEGDDANDNDDDMNDNDDDMNDNDDDMNDNDDDMNDNDDDGNVNGDDDNMNGNDNDDDSNTNDDDSNTNDDDSNDNDDGGNDNDDDSNDNDDNSHDNDDNSNDNDDNSNDNDD